MFYHTDSVFKSFDILFKRHCVEGMVGYSIYSGKAVSARKTSYRIEIERKMFKEDFFVEI